jgi:DNA polymerase-3 subunit epsilon
MREVVLDTETTGLDPAGGHRIVEIGCVELLNRLPTGRTFQRFLNPERSIPTDAFAVHGLSISFLADKPRFAEIADQLLAFIADSPLVMHNAAFDLGFLNAELRRLGFDSIGPERAIDTVEIARRKFPGAPASLDALCRRFQVDLSGRVLHGALKDARLLACIYLELHGGREPALSLVSGVARRIPGIASQQWRPKLLFPSPAEEAAHRAFVDAIPCALWHKQELSEAATVAGETEGLADNDYTIMVG